MLCTSKVFHNRSFPKTAFSIDIHININVATCSVCLQVKLHKQSICSQKFPIILPIIHSSFTQTSVSKYAVGIACRTIRIFQRNIINNSGLISNNTTSLARIVSNRIGLKLFDSICPKQDLDPNF